MNRPAPVEITYKNMRFLITHNPTNATLNKFIEVRLKVLACSEVRTSDSFCRKFRCFIFMISNLSFQELKKYGVTTVVRVCEATYDATLVVKEGIQVLVCLNSSSPFFTKAQWAFSASLAVVVEGFL